MEELENINAPTQGGSPTPPPAPTPSIPIAPSIPQAHQMMGSMPTAAAATASTSGFWGNLIAIFILILGGGSLYLAYTKTNPSTEGTPVDHIEGFTLTNDSTSETTGSSENNSTTTPDESNSNSNPSEPTSESTNSGTTTTQNTTASGEVPFNCADILTVASLKTFTNDSAPIVIGEQKGSATLTCNYDVQYGDTQAESYPTSPNVSIEFHIPTGYLTMDYLYESMKSSFTPNETVVGVGTKAFLAYGDSLGVLSTNGKYYFWLTIVHRTSDTAHTKYIKELGKAIDTALSKY